VGVETVDLSDIGLFGLFAIGVFMAYRIWRSPSPRLDPGEVPRILGDADERVRAGKPDEAIELLELALKYHVGNAGLSAKLQELRKDQ